MSYLNFVWQYGRRDFSPFQRNLETWNDKVCDGDEERSLSRPTRTRLESLDENELNYVAPSAGGTADRQNLKSLRFYFQKIFQLKFTDYATAEDDAGAFLFLRKKITAQDFLA